MSIQSIRANDDSPIKTMSLSDLADHVRGDIPTEHEMSLILQRAANLAEEAKMPALALLFNVLSEEPSEIAAMWHTHVLGLGGKLHADTDGPALCRVVSVALGQFADDEGPIMHAECCCDDPECEHRGLGTFTPADPGEPAKEKS